MAVLELPTREQQQRAHDLLHEPGAHEMSVGEAFERIGGSRTTARIALEYAVYELYYGSGPLPRDPSEQEVIDRLRERCLAIQQAAAPPPELRDLLVMRDGPPEFGPPPLGRVHPRALTDPDAPGFYFTPTITTDRGPGIDLSGVRELMQKEHHPLPELRDLLTLGPGDGEFLHGGVLRTPAGYSTHDITGLIERELGDTVTALQPEALPAPRRPRRRSAREERRRRKREQRARQRYRNRQRVRRARS